MGQLLLGFRSLIIKAAIFVVMAALLAWALGGTLWPRPHVVDGERISAAGYQYWWQMRVGGNDYDQPRWRLMMREEGRPARAFMSSGGGAEDPMEFEETAGPVRVASRDMVAFAGLHQGEWLLLIAENGEITRAPGTLDDRLAVELALTGFRSGELHQSAGGPETDPAASEIADSD
ncbi:MAG: hypothetical protein EA377_07750 [Phycisphaerales bacterium]|nr:MAG: hypothetical protein EA377_07750 [Phycisphaerales bacterium]